MNRNVRSGCWSRYWLLWNVNLYTLLRSCTKLPWCRLYHLWLLWNNFLHWFRFNGLNDGGSLHLVFTTNKINLMSWDLTGASEIAWCFYLIYRMAAFLIIHSLTRHLLMGKLIQILIHLPPLFTINSWRCFCQINLLWYHIMLRIHRLLIFPSSWCSWTLSHTFILIL